MSNNQGKKNKLRMQTLVCSVAEECMAYVVDQEDNDPKSKRMRYTSDGDLENDGNYIAGRGNFQQIYNEFESHIPASGALKTEIAIVFAIRKLQHECFTHNMKNVINAFSNNDAIDTVSEIATTSDWKTLLGFLLQFSTSASSMTKKCSKLAKDQVEKEGDGESDGESDGETDAGSDEENDDDDSESDSDESYDDEDSSSSEEEDSDEYCDDND